MGLAEKEKKKKLSFQLVPSRLVIENSKKREKKLKKLKNIIMASFQAETVQEWPRKSEKKTIVPINSYSIQNRELKKNCKKIQKIKKHPNGFISSQNGSGEAEKERKKNYRSDRCLTDQEQRIPKKQQKNSKN